MRNLVIACIFFISCKNERGTPIQASTTAERDSMLSKADSTNEGLRDVLSDLYETKQQVVANINRLKKENTALKAKANKEEAPVYLSRDMEYGVDDKDKTIRDLLKELQAYKSENTRLRNKLYADSLFFARQNPVNTDKVEEPVEKPTSKSLVISLDKRMRGEGEISDAAVTLYIIPFNKQTSKQAKKLMKYEIFCDTKYINSLGAREANCYKGQYFFNDLPPGKYLLKVCAYYGNYMVINRSDGYQMVAMQISPPIQ